MASPHKCSSGLYLEGVSTNPVRLSPERAVWRYHLVNYLIQGNIITDMLHFDLLEDFIATLIGMCDFDQYVMHQFLAFL